MKKIIIILVFILNIISAHGQTVPLSNTTLWKVSGNGLQKDSYILLSSYTCNETIKLKPKLLHALQSSDLVSVENNFTDKNSVQKMKSNMIAVADSQRIKNVLYNAENISGLQELYKNDPFYQYQSSDAVFSKHVSDLAIKIENHIRQNACFIQINMATVLLPRISVFELLKSKGYTISPVND